MTHDQIKELAREAGLSFLPEANCPLVRIVQKAVEIERNACVDLCMDMVLYTGLDCANAIREMGDAA